MIRVEEYLGERGFAELEGPWLALHREAGASPFLSPLWLGAWHRHLSSAHRIRLVAARDRGGDLIGLLPLFEQKHGAAGIPLALRLGFLGEKTGGADYLDLLALSARRGEVVEAIVSHLVEDDALDLIDLFELPADSALIPAFSRHALSRPDVEASLEPRYVCPQVELRGAWEEVLARSRRASNLRRRWRQALAMGAEYRAVTEPAEARAAFERFLALHERRWEGEGGSDGIHTPAHIRFHHEVVEQLAKARWLRFEELWIRGGCRASIYGIECGRTFYFYQSGFDPEWSARSVGLVLLGMSMEQAVRRGLDVYDFLHGVESYKLDWATRATQTLRLRVARRSAGAAWLLGLEGTERRMRGWVRSLLPEGAVDYLRRHRKARRARLGGVSWEGGTRPSAV